MSARESPRKANLRLADEPSVDNPNRLSRGHDRRQTFVETGRGGSKRPLIPRPTMNVHEIGAAGISRVQGYDRPRQQACNERTDQSNVRGSLVGLFGSC